MDLIERNECMSQHSSKYTHLKYMVDNIMTSIYKYIYINKLNNKEFNETTRQHEDGTYIYPSIVFLAILPLQNQKLANR